MNFMRLLNLALMTTEVVNQICHREPFQCQALGTCDPLGLPPALGKDSCSYDPFRHDVLGDQGEPETCDPAELGVCPPTGPAQGLRRAADVAGQAIYAASPWAQVDPQGFQPASTGGSCSSAVLSSPFVKCGLRGYCDPHGPGRLATVAQGVCSAVPKAVGAQRAAATVLTLNFPPMPPGSNKLRPLHLPGGLVADLDGKAGTIQICWGPGSAGSDREFCVKFPPNFLIRKPFPELDGGPWRGANQFDFALRKVYWRDGQGYAKGWLIPPVGPAFPWPAAKRLDPLPLGQNIRQTVRLAWDVVRARHPGVFFR